MNEIEQCGSFGRISHIVLYMNERKLEKYFKALANRHRFAMVGYLKKAGEVNVSRIAFEMGLFFMATSRHLLILECANILYKIQRNTEVFTESR